MNSKEKVIVVMVIMFVGAIIFSKKNYILEADEVTIIYMEELPEKNFRITQTSILWNKKVPVVNNMFEYDKEFIGTQDAVFKYKGEEVTFKLTILPRKLDSPTLSLVDDKIMWSSVKGASSYQIFINDKAIEVTATEFSLKDDSVPAGALSIGVRAKTQNEKYADSYPSNLLNVRKLGAVNDISYKNGKLSWKAIEGSTYYQIFINNSEYTTKENNFTVTDFQAGNNIVKIIAVSDDNSVIASEAYEKRFTKWQVKNITYNSGSICWDVYPSQGECMYQVIINGIWHEWNSNHFEYPLTNDVEYSISVQAFPASAKSIESDIVETTIIYEKLKAPKATLLIGNYKDTYTIKIDEVVNADGYKINLFLYAGSNVLKRDSKISSTKMEYEFGVEGNVSRIVAEVIAVDSKGRYMDSNVTTVEKIIR